MLTAIGLSEYFSLLSRGSLMNRSSPDSLYGFSFIPKQGPVGRSLGSHKAVFINVVKNEVGTDTGLFIVDFKNRRYISLTEGDVGQILFKILHNKWRLEGVIDLKHLLSDGPETPITLESFQILPYGYKCPPTYPTT